MRRIIFLSALFVVCCTAYAQPIYRGLNYGMSASAAKNEFKKNKDLYDAVDFGNGFVWRIYTQNLIYNNDSLVVVLMTPKGAALGLSNDGATSYLEFSRAFFENKGYQLFFEPDYWQYPLNFSSKYGLLLFNPEKTIMVQLYPTYSKSSGMTFCSANLKIMNYDWFIKSWDLGHKIQQEKSDQSGF